MSAYRWTDAGLWPGELLAVMPAMAELIAAAWDSGASPSEARGLLMPGLSSPQPQRVGRAVLIPVLGLLTQRGTLLGMSMMQVSGWLRDAERSSGVDTIVMDIDSPGGSLAGLMELHDEIMQVRRRKRIVAVANSLAASAAYVVASAAHELVVTPSGQVGGLGVQALHVDISRAEEKAGVKTTLITAGKYKGEGNPYAPLTAEAKAHVQRQIDQQHADLAHRVAVGRSMTFTGVMRADWGNGRTVLADSAVRVGAADRTGTLEDELAGARGQGSSQRPGLRAEAGDLEIRRRRLALRARG